MPLSEERYAAMRWNSPLSEDHASRLLQRLAVGSDDLVVDLGCGWGELVLRAVEDTGASAIGIDTDEQVLQRGRDNAQQRGLADRVTFVAGDAAGWGNQCERAICIGAAHAWGGTTNALRRLHEIVKPGGRLLFGDGCWERPATAAAAAIFDDVLPLGEIVRAVISTGWRVLHLSTADQREWDEFESTWLAGPQEWLLANPELPEAAAERARLDGRLLEYVESYRGVLGFCYLVLGR